MRNEVFEKIEYHALNNSQGIAFEEENRTITWESLYNEINKLSADELKKGRINSFLWIDAKKSIDTLITILSCISYGINFVLVNPDIPLKLREEYLRKLEAFRFEQKKEGPLFGIFTSGSTGEPKLVIKSVRGIWKYIESYCEQFAFTKDDVFGSQVPIFFDAFCKDLYATIFLGARLVLIPKYMFASPKELIVYLNRKKITVIQWVPTAYRLCMSFDVFSQVKPEFLKYALFVGEIISPVIVNYWRKALPYCTFINLYGSSEVVGSSCFYVIDREFDTTENIPIGKPFAGFNVALKPDSFNEESLGKGQALPASEGQIIVTATGLMLDLSMNLTEDSALETLKSYYTGDYGRLDSNGNLLFIGRKDDIVKHNGIRINLQEIERAIVSIDCIDDAVSEFDSQEDYIKVKVTIKADSDKMTISDIEKAIKKLLPKYMIPKKIEIVEQIPLLPNGKKRRRV